ncbi:MAG: hypothetical protein PF484_04555 [Bacteroidales bacterium]|jgi:hypothetical protein|nr:hypothetical protein [Bacteroidales bacterium]
MKNIKLVLLLIFSILISPSFSQNFVDLKSGRDTEVNGILVSFNTVTKGTKRGNDLYRLTVTITNRGNDYMRIFNHSPEVFIKKPENAIAYFQITNATGKALSATNAYFYPKPMYIKVPYKCKKCPPIKKDEDPYEHYTKSVIVGTQFVSGSTLNKVLNIRVPEGETPTVRVMIY